MLVTLHISRGWSVRELSRKFGISRGRIRRIIVRYNHRRQTGKEPMQAKTKKISKLDQYKEYITELLQEHRDPPITNQRILELIREKGYQGGKTILGDYLASIRRENAKEPVYCVETSPGEMGSHDWSEYYVYFSETDKKQKVIFFSFILNYSRRQYIEVAHDKTQLTLFKCLINTFTYFDGVPRRIKSDNQKPCVDRWEFGKPVFNAKFLDFATHYHFAPLSITPGRPRENLKIERPFYYLEKSFLNGRSFFNSDDLESQLKDWLRDINDQRVHRTTKQTPIALYKKEYPYLQPLPQKHYDTSVTGYRIVNNESCIEWSGYFYVVPSGHMHKSCLVRETENQIIIYADNDSELISHPLAAKGSTDKYIGRSNKKNNSSTPVKIKKIIERLESMGPVMGEYIAELKKHKPNSLRHHLLRVLSLRATYQKQDILTAVSRGLKYKVYESGAIENFLSVNAEKKNEITLFSKKR
jgi:transposase